MAITLDRMVERGPVARVRSTQDQRAQLIKLTPAGAAFTQKAEKIASKMQAMAPRVLSEAERLLLIELLRKVALGPAAGQP